LAAFSLGIFIAAYAIVAVLASAPAALPAVVMIGRPLWPALPLLPYAMIALVAVLALIAWRERGTVAAEPIAPAPPADAAARLPAASLLLLALVATILAYIAVLPEPVFLVLQSTTKIVPTLVVYFCLLAALFLVLTRRSARAVVLLGLALLPLVYWGYVYWQASPPRSSMPLLTTDGWYPPYAIAQR
jgi:hypothetical protein